MSQLRLYIWLVLIYPVSIWAQEAPKTEVMFLINSSGSMQRALNNTGQLDGFAQCAVSVSGASNGTHELSVMNQIQNVLTGAPRLPSGEEGQRCIYQVLETSDTEHTKALDLFNQQIPFINRSLMPTGTQITIATNRNGYVTAERACCRQTSNDRCSIWEVCDDLAGDETYETNGIMQSFSEVYKFGLMSTDVDPAKAESFGEDENDPALSVAPQFVQAPVIASFYAGVRGEPVSQSPNLGAMPMMGNIQSLPTGSLVTPHRGRLSNGRVLEKTKIGEQARQIKAHTDYVIRRLRGLRPSGFSALGAQLRDYRVYLSELEQGGSLKDTDFSCRKRVLIIITEHENQSRTYDSAGCFPGVEAIEPAACPPSDQYPYGTIESELERLSQQDNLSVHFLGFGLSEIKRQAYAGILQGVGEVYALKDALELKQTLSQILGSVDEGRISYRAPLILSPNESDDVDDQVRQYRITGYSTLSAGGRYGRVEVTAFGCPNGGGQDPLGRLRTLPAFSYEAAQKRALQSSISSFASHPERDRAFGMNGTFEPSIVSPGVFGPQPNVTEEISRTLTRLSDGESFKAIYELLEGYFGPAIFGTSDDACRPLCGLPSDQKQRQLGVVETGRFVAVHPPRLNLGGDAYQAYQTEQRKRPTLVATGAGDGMIHFFRLEDGYEVFNFVPASMMGRLKNGSEESATDGLRADGELVARNMILCRSLGEGSADCPADPESFKIRSFVAGTTGTSTGNVYAIDVTDATEALKSDRPNTISVDSVNSWDVIAGYQNPTEAEEAEWYNDMGYYLNER